MYAGKKILALIPARGGSKGIPNKNIKSLAGRPLILWTIEAALNSVYIDRLVLSSDHPGIIEIARDNGCEAPFVRPRELARDESASMDVIMHALSQIEGEYDYLLLLQPTSPFRTNLHIDGIIESCIGQQAQMMISVSKKKAHPLFAYESAEGFLKPFLGFRPQVRRQDIPPVYYHNGALYLASIQLLEKTKSYNIPEARLFEMHGAANLDIDDMDDWEYAEYLIAAGKL